MRRLFIFFLLFGYICRASLEYQDALAEQTRSGPDGKLLGPNLTRCLHEPEIYCFVRNGCIDGQGGYDNIEKFGMTMMHDWSDGQRMQLEQCDVALIMEKDSDDENIYKIDYKTNERGFKLPLKLDPAKMIIEIRNENDEFVCSTGCVWYERKKSYISNSYFYSGKIKFYEPTNKAKLWRCFNETQVMCFVGSSCLDQTKGPHKEIIRLDPNLISTYSPEKRKSIEQCDFGAVIDPSYDTSFLYFIDYHTTDEYALLPMHILFPSNPILQRTFTFDDGEPFCTPTCALFFEELSDSLNSIYFSGRMYLRESFDIGQRPINETTRKRRRANISSCFEDIEITCFIGEACIHESIEKHTRMVKLGSWLKSMWRHGSASFRRRAEECDVAATIVPLKKEGIGYFEMEYHSSPESMGIKIKDMKFRRIWINNGAIRCSPDCDFTAYLDGDGDWKDASGQFWKGTIFLGKEPEALTDAKQEPAKKESSIGTIFTIIGCSLVAIIIIVVVVVTVIQRRVNEKTRKRRESIEQKAVIIAKREAQSCEISAERKLARRKKAEAVPLIATTPPSNDSPIDDSAGTRASAKDCSGKDKSNKGNSNKVDSNKDSSSKGNSNKDI